MKKLRYTNVLFYVLLLLGCSQTVTTSTPVQINFDEIAINMKNQHNYEMTVNYDFNSQELDALVNLVLHSELEDEKTGNMKLVSTATISLFNKTTTESNTDYIEFQNDQIFHYSLNEEGFNSIWQKEKLTNFSFLRSKMNLNKKNIASILKNNTDIKFIENKTLSDGTKVKVYSIKMNSQELLREAFDYDYIKTISGFSEMDFTNHAKEIDYTVSIDSNKNVIRKVEVDLDNFLNKVYNTDYLLDGMIVWFDFSLEFMNINQTIVNIPQEIINQVALTQPEVPFVEDVNFTSVKKNLDFIVTDSISDPNEPIIYMTSKDNKTLFAYNFVTNEMNSIVFELMPESLTYRNNKLYISLLKGEHSSIYLREKQEGALAIIDLTSFTITKQFDINIDPYDIEVDQYNNIFISSGAVGDQVIRVYNEEGLYLNYANMEDLSTIKYHPQLNKLYSIDNNSISKYYSYTFNNNKFGYIQTDYLSGYALSNSFSISTDGLYLFSGSSIFKIDSSIKYFRNIPHTFTSVAFDNVHFYIANNKRYVYQYDYSTFEPLFRYVTSGEIQTLYVNQNKLIILSKDSTNTYYFEIIDII